MDKSRFLYPRAYRRAVVRQGEQALPLTIETEIRNSRRVPAWVDYFGVIFGEYAVQPISSQDDSSIHLTSTFNDQR